MAIRRTMGTPPKPVQKPSVKPQNKVAPSDKHMAGFPVMRAAERMSRDVGIPLAVARRLSRSKPPKSQIGE